MLSDLLAHDILNPNYYSPFFYLTFDSKVSQE
jgi:hypothetical protein